MTIQTRLKTRIRRTFERLPARRTALQYLVYYDGGSSSLAALREACEMAPSGARITAVFLDTVPQEHEITDDVPVNPMLAQAVLAAAIVNARLYETEINTLIVPCHAKGPALVGLANQHPNAVLFVGITESEMNGQPSPFTDYVLQLAPCKVVLVGS